MTRLKRKCLIKLETDGERERGKSGSRQRENHLEGGSRRREEEREGQLVILGDSVDEEESSRSRRIREARSSFGGDDADWKRESIREKLCGVTEREEES